MIRRVQKSPDEADRWVLFQQPLHAELSARLAEDWRAHCVRAIEPHDEIMSAIAMHDDGWADWEQHPQVQDGQPIAFDEMPLADSLRIWRESIAIGLVHGPLEAFAIAGHFSRLLREHGSWQNADEQRRMAEQFLAWTDQQMGQWQRVWQAKSAEHSSADCTRGAEFVRLFDALSLWLLCAERTKPVTISTPEGPAITLTPESTTNFRLSPWPYTTALRTLSAVGRSIPVAHYRSSDELLNVPSRQVELTWTLLPHEQR